MLDDVTSVALHTALSGLHLRQRVIADNIANIETPNFHARKVSFEKALGAAIASGGNPADVSPTIARSLEPTRLDGNNVNLDEETISSIDAGLRYQLALTALNNKINGLSSVIKGVA
ncbi:flagellar biosynthesis protein FlgB [Planosporangium flavigriseum]|uniref:Flagellar basal body rod protein FlgB n=1 Tax=Planosporangium flavigriseum TaxID=373681 RepID=A0A8J3PMU9_9ACTN|nr:flagellar basal body protein [Planosporangium flavigriseum]NJC66356.1 flagellar biosynthesis protein FlgB [Planosporangium flavigriseum]GIG74238.1 flagellar basal body rod protein FlgB [Planosporangium flavigriseum]